MADFQYKGEPLSIAIDEAHVVALPRRVLRVRLTGLMFETDKAFLLPRAMHGIRALVGIYLDHRNMAAAVTGHTDRVGAPGYNLGLSDERARAIAHYLRDDVDGWLVWYTKQPFSQAWGTLEDQHMMSAVVDPQTGRPSYEGAAHGVLDPPTRDAVARFQASQGLTADGTPGPQTRRALITEYMGLDGTTLPSDSEVQLLGCGEHHNEILTADGVDERENRRAEVFLFDPGPVDPPAPENCPGPGCPYETWKERTVQTYDFDHDRPVATGGLFDFEVLAALGEAQHET